eukprot:PhM_4_TR16426/c0_g1_i1/m.36235
MHPFKELTSPRLVSFIVETAHIRMFQQLICRGARSGVKRKHFREKVDATRLTNVWHELCEFLRRFGWHFRKVLSCLWLQILGNFSTVGCPQHITNERELIEIVFTREEGTAIADLCHYAACRPDINSCSIRRRHHQKFWGTIPPGNDVLRELLGQFAFGALLETTGKTEVTYFEVTVEVHEQVGWFEVAVHHPATVKVLEATEDLIHKVLHVLFLKLLLGTNDCVEVCVKKLEHKIDVTKNRLLFRCKHRTNTTEISVVDEAEKLDLTENALGIAHILEDALAFLYCHFAVRACVHGSTHKTV